MDRKSAIIAELESSVKAAVTENSRDGVVSGDATQQICNVIEAIFIHGLRDAFFVKNSRYSKYPEPNFWPFVSKFTHKAIKTQIAGLRQIRNEVGKARAWVRIVLNEAAFENYLTALSKDKGQLNVFYTNAAFLRDDEKVEALIGYLRALTKIPIVAPYNSTILNGWTPSPLTLAGLIVGKEASKPVKASQSPIVQHRMAKRNVSSNSSLEEEEEAEVALNAGDMLDESTNSETLPSTLEESALFAQSPDIADDDERSSVYSHPSMLDGGCSIPLRPSFVALLSSTPENGVPFPLPYFHDTLPQQQPNFTPATLPREEQSSEVIVHRRRVVRQRRNSRSSSRSDGERTSLIGSTGGGRDPSPNTQPLAAGTQDRLMNIIAPQTKTECRDDAIEAVKTPSNEGSDSDGAATNRDTIMEKEVKLPDEPTPSQAPGAAVAVSGTSYEVEKASPPPITVPVTAAGDADDRNDNNDVFATSLRDELNISALDEVVASHGTPTTSAVHIDEANHHRLADEVLACSSSSLSTDYSGPMMSLDSALGRFDKAPTESSSSSDVRTLHLRPDPPIDGLDKSQVSNKTGGQHQLPPLVPRPSQASPSTSRANVAQPLRRMESTGEGEGLTVLFLLQPERGLDAQDFRCPTCQKSIGGTSFNVWHTCNLDGRLYCEECMGRGEESVIPARLLLNWDTRPRPVSKASMALLKSIASRPLFHVELLNRQLYEHSWPMKRVEQLRRKLGLVVMYLLNCKQSVADDIRKRIWPHDHWYVDRHLYSLEDLEGVASGALEKKIDSICAFATNHVNGCTLCLQKGFVCELCSSKQVIYPFQVELVERCAKCYSVFHKECLDGVGSGRSGSECPKCMRRRKHSSSANLTIKSSQSHHSQIEATSAPMFTLPLPSI